MLETSLRGCDCVVSFSPTCVWWSTYCTCVFDWNDYVNTCWDLRLGCGLAAWCFSMKLRHDHIFINLSASLSFRRLWCWDGTRSSELLSVLTLFDQRCWRKTTSQFMFTSSLMLWSHVLMFILWFFMCRLLSLNAFGQHLFEACWVRIWCHLSYFVLLWMKRSTIFQRFDL